MNDVRHQPESLRHLQQRLEASERVDIEPARSPYDRTGLRFSDPARRSYPKASGGLLEALSAVLLSVGPVMLLALICCWGVLTYGPAVRQLLGL